MEETYLHRSERSCAMQWTAKTRAPFLPVSCPPHIEKFPPALLQDFLPSPALPGRWRPGVVVVGTPKNPEEM